MLIAVCAWHRRYWGWPKLLGVRRWWGRGFIITHGLCARCGAELQRR